MEYTNISVDTLPTILAGPMVRRVEAGSVSIWLALKEAVTVTVTVLREDGTPLGLFGSSAPLQVGANLHLCTVTVRGAGLEAGCRYLYRVTTPAKDFKTLLGSDAVLTALCYSPNTLPSFYVPPATADGLRIAHGGHRKPHGLGKDALAALQYRHSRCGGPLCQQPGDRLVFGALFAVSWQLGLPCCAQCSLAST